MRIRDAQLWISKTLEGSFNTPESTGTNYSFVPTTSPQFLLPAPEKVNDANRAGRNAASHACNTWWTPLELPLTDDIETDVPARLMARAFGGSVTDTLVDTGVYDHTFPLLNPQTGVNLPSFSMAALLGSASWLFSGCRVNGFRMFQQGDQRVQYEANVMNSGKFTTPHGLTSLPGLGTTVCMDAYRTEVSYKDSGSSSVALHTLGTMIEWSAGLTNNLRPKRRIGDTALTVESGTAAYVRSMPLGQERAVDISMKLDFANLNEWKESIKNGSCTDLKFTAKGPLIDDTYRHEVEIIVPKFTFEVVTPDEDEGDAAIQINVLPFEDSVSKGAITGRVRNASATLV